MKRSSKKSLAIVVVAVIVSVLLCGFLVRITDGFQVLDPKEVFAAKLNEENLFFEKVEDGEIFDNYQIDAVVKDGVITLNGKIAALDNTQLTFSDSIEFVTMKLEKGTYTFTCFDDPTVKSYFAVGEYVSGGAVHTWLADFEKVPAIDFGTEFGTVHERTLTLEEDTTITFKIMVAEGAELNKVKGMPVIVSGEDEGNFYLSFFAK